MNNQDVYDARTRFLGYIVISDVIVIISVIINMIRSTESTLNRVVLISIFWILSLWWSMRINKIYPLIEKEEK